MIHDKSAFASILVNSFRFYFLFKTTIFQMVLVTLPYSPRIQLCLIIGMELVSVIATWVKYKAIKHVTNKVNLV